MTDPVCGMNVNPETGRFREAYKDQEYGFCSEACRKVFLMNPQRYLPWRPGKQDRRKKE